MVFGDNGEITEYEDLIRRSAHKLSKKYGVDFNDLCQEAYLKLIQKRDEFDPNKGDTRHYASVIIRNAMICYVRRYRHKKGDGHLLREHPLGLEDDINSSGVRWIDILPTKDLEEKDPKEIIEPLLKRINHKPYRDIMELYFDGMKKSEIARFVGLHASGVRIVVNRYLRKLYEWDII